MLCVVVLPSSGLSLGAVVGVISRRGDSQGGDRIFNSRSPLSEPDYIFLFIFVLLDSVVGEITQGRGVYYTLVLPSVFCFWIVFIFYIFVSGRFTG